MSPNTSFKKNCERRRIAADVERFLAQGGQIREFGPGASGRINGLPNEFVNAQRRKAQESNKGKGGWS